VGFWATFRDFKRSTQVVLGLSLLLGVIMLVSFSLTDLGINVTLGSWDPKPHWLRQFDADWYNNHAYIPNILAGFTASLIGVPLAVVVLATFTIQREDSVARRAAEQRAKVAWQSFSEAITELCNDQRIWALTDGMEELEFIEGRAFKTVNNYIVYHLRGGQRHHTLVNGDSDYDVIPDDAEELRQAMRHIEPHFEYAYRAVIDRVGTDEQLQLMWARAKSAWNVLDRYVRIQLVERTIDWFDRDIDNALLKDMGRDGNPIGGISTVLGEGAPLWVPPINVSGALETLQNNNLIRPVDLDDLLTSGVGVQFFGYNSVAFSPYDKDAAKFIIELRQRVEAVNATGWPVSAFAD
jgi:hypothetical protein